MSVRPLPPLLLRFVRDRRGSNAVEFAILAVPAIALLLFSLQIGLYAMTKAALDTGVVRTAESLQGQFGASSAPVAPTGGALKAGVAAKAGGLVVNGGQLAVEVRPLAGLSGARTAIVDQSVDLGAPHGVLAVRASFVTPTFGPGLSAVLTAYSSALVRRQNL